MTVRPPSPAAALAPARAAGPAADAAPLLADDSDGDGDGRRESRYPPPATSTTAAAAKARTFRVTAGLPRGLRPPDAGSAARGAPVVRGAVPRAAPMVRVAAARASAAMTPLRRAVSSAGIGAAVVRASNAGSAPSPASTSAQRGQRETCASI